MDGRKLFRLYAQKFHKLEAKEFVDIENEFYNQDKLLTKNSDGELEISYIDYKQIVHWLIKEIPNSMLNDIIEKNRLK